MTTKDEDNPVDTARASLGETFEDVVRRRISRRGLLAGAGAAAGVLVLDRLTGARLAGAGEAEAAPTPLSFSQVPLTLEDKVVVPTGYRADVLLRWGDSISSGATNLTHDRGSLNQTADLQRMRFGYNCDFVAFMPLPLGSQNSNNGLLWVNHEYTNEELMFHSYSAEHPDASQVEVALAAHGASVVEIGRDDAGRWSYRQNSAFNRRITGETTIQITGPASGSPLLRVSYDPQGTTSRGMLNNCGGGKTPWGTVLTCEENFNQYFANASSLPASDPRRAIHQRYGVTTGASERGWEKVYSRFDIAKEPNEPFRFGWVTEIDPYDPTFTPKKRTALGRVKHEAADTTLAKDGRAVVYTGDDERFDYMYKFVSTGRFSASDRATNLRLLDSGVLYVAKFSDDGSGTWLPLVQGQRGLTAEAGFATQADVLINTRGAGDIVGATKMDRPEDIEVNPVNGKVYGAFTNNTNRTAAQTDGPNPRASNRHGHIIEITESGNDAGSLTFSWKILLLCGVPGSGDGSFFAGFDPASAAALSSPDNIAFDKAGNLWIATDGQPSTLSENDAICAVPVEGSDRGHVRRFLTGPFGAEVASLAFTPDSSSLFVSIQHPGERGTGPNSSNSSIATPTSLWPDGITPPRPSVVVVTSTAPASPTIGV